EKLRQVPRHRRVLRIRQTQCREARSTSFLRTRILVDNWKEPLDEHVDEQLSLELGANRSTHQLRAAPGNRERIFREVRARERRREPSRPCATCRPWRRATHRARPVAPLAKLAFAALPLSLLPPSIRAPRRRSSPEP